MKEGLSYDDVLIIPKRSPVDTRAEVDVSSNITPEHEIDVPIVSAPMDSVTEHEMAQKMSDVGGVGIIHRYLSPEEQAEEVQKVDGLVGATIGIEGEWFERSQLLVSSGVDFLCVDVAHGHLEKALDRVSEIKESFPDTQLIAGNVATKQGVKDLVTAGADGVKIGIGPGSHCITREVAGVGVPQFTAVRQASEGLDELVQASQEYTRDDVVLIADGGIRKGGDVAKALTAGADCVMIGGLFSGCTESPAPVVETKEGKYKKTRGMASEDAQSENIDEEESYNVTEGESGLVRLSGSVEEEVKKLVKGLRSGISYSGATDLETARENVEYMKKSESAIQRDGAHGVLDTEMI